MTHPTHDKTTFRIDRRTDEPWIIGMFAVCGLIASAVVLFMAAGSDGGKLVSEAVQAEFPIAQSSSSAAGTALPGAAPVTRLAAGH
ncbi:hypothetical protein [Bradyrhizobium prioriisuperbiae]|uniref:hypothetical protein n=1 Tax=Bradyrhizobium prioriisuperbiae TaxID=2854389 RepID=UPI0028E43732|nr:hypothetical protein [Bradyrhizobium prioritasuperba]